ncbi:MAG: hypothetical protein KJ957_04240 [Candidatus Omnitrophica bacterium]|nr:hypothetical protein [Candidatus Omnitrophota bacterium]
MKNNEYNLNNIHIVFILVFFLAFCSVAIGENNDDEVSLYAVIKVGEKEKLYTKGDIFYSEADITKCFRIQDIDTDFLILKDVDSEDTFKIKVGEVIPLKGTERIFKKTVKVD